ncbi:MAG: methyltransferase domain-containing protein [Patescibacteria group bacterium]
MDKWHLKKIPKIAHFYWGGGILSYARYMTVASFQKFNTDWEIRVYAPIYPSTTKSWGTFEQKYELKVDDYSPKLKELGITIIPINFARIGIDNSLSEVHKSDFLRWWLLSTVGGLWSDFDILYFKSINNVSFNKSEYSNIDVGVCICEYGYSIGFMLASPNNEYYQYIWEKAKMVWNKDNYQCIGSVLFNSNFPTIESIKKRFPNLNPINIPMETVYAYDANHINEIYQSTDTSKLLPTSIGLHFYAGHNLAGEFLQKTNGGLNISNDCLPSKILNFINSDDLPTFINKLIKPNNSVLDLGCGDKKFINRLKGIHTTLDIWEPFNPDVLWDLNKLPLPFEDNSFNVILAIDVIEHLKKENGKLLLEELKRIVKNKIILFTPLWWTENLYYMNNIESNYYGNPYERHLSLWTKEDFKEWKENLGINFLSNYYFGIWSKNE